MMRWLFPLLLAGCGGPAEAGDLWLTLDHQEPTERIKLHLPGNWLTQSAEPVWIETTDGRVDLHAQAVELQKKRVGSTLTWKLESSDPVTVSLATESLTGEPAKTLGLQTRGPKGNGITATLELTPDQVGQARSHLDGVIDVQGLKIDLNQAMCEQLKASPPVVLLETTGPRGGGLTIDTR